MNRELCEQRASTNSFVAARPQSKLSYKRFSVDRIRSNLASARINESGRILQQETQMILHGVSS